MYLVQLFRNVERAISVIIFLLMVALFFFNVISRQFGALLASDFGWIDEAVRIMSLFLVFWTLGLALERGKHVGVTSWRDGIAEVTGIPVRKVIDAVGVIFCAYLVWLSWRMTNFVFNTGQQSPTLNIPIFWIYLAPALGFNSLGLRYALSLLGMFDRFSKNEGEFE